MPFVLTRWTSLPLCLGDQELQQDILGVRGLFPIYLGRREFCVSHLGRTSVLNPSGDCYVGDAEPRRLWWALKFKCGDQCVLWHESEVTIIKRGNRFLNLRILLLNSPTSKRACLHFVLKALFENTATWWGRDRTLQDYTCPCLIPPTHWISLGVSVE